MLERNIYKKKTPDIGIKFGKYHLCLEDSVSKKYNFSNINDKQLQHSSSVIVMKSEYYSIVHLNSP